MGRMYAAMPLPTQANHVDVRILQPPHIYAGCQPAIVWQSMLDDSIHPAEEFFGEVFFA